MRAISCALISYTLAYYAFRINHSKKKVRMLSVYFLITSWLLLIASFILMILGV